MWSWLHLGDVTQDQTRSVNRSFETLFKLLLKTFLSEILNFWDISPVRDFFTHPVQTYYTLYSKRMGPFYDLQKYALSGKMTQIKVIGVMKNYLLVILNLILRVIWKYNLKFFNRNLLFWPLKRTSNFMFKYVVISKWSKTSRGFGDQISEYMQWSSISRKMTRIRDKKLNKNAGSFKIIFWWPQLWTWLWGRFGYRFSQLTFRWPSRQDRLQTLPAKIRLAQARPEKFHWTVACL